MTPHPEHAIEQTKLRSFQDAIASIERMSAAEVTAAAADTLAEDALLLEHHVRLGRLPNSGSFVLGRLDSEAGPHYVGSRPLTYRGESLVYSVLAAPFHGFYTATSEHRMGFALKRRFRIDDWTLLDIEDDFDVRPDRPEVEERTTHLVNDILMDEIERDRTGEMREILRSIQIEQWEAIHAPFDQPVVIQGGPGTGKTAVGLARAAAYVANYRQAEPSRILVVGPTRAFMKYIKAVLPSMGAAEVTQRSLSELFGSTGGAEAWVSPSITLRDTPAVARVKGSPAMASVIRRALRRRIRPPERDLDIETESGPIRLEKRLVNQLLADVLQMRWSYESGRRRFIALLTSQAREQAAQRDAVTPQAVELASLIVWPKVQPESVLNELYSSTAELRASGEGALTEGEMAYLLRRESDSGGWSIADVYLLDEVASQMGLDAGVPKYDHIVLDEAQDLTPMQLRAVVRRNNGTSITLLGDLAQATGPILPTSWAEVVANLSLHAPHVRELKTGYRIPRPAMDLAAQLLPVFADNLEPPTSFRPGDEPAIVRLPLGGDLLAEAADRAVSLVSNHGGSVAVITERSLSADMLAQLADGAASRHEGLFVGDGRVGQLKAPIVVTDVERAKGLEFDSVVVVDPDAIIRSSPQGARWLYIAMTRCTHRLTMVVEHDLPIELGGSPKPEPSELGQQATSSAEASAGLAELLDALAPGDRELVIDLARRLARASTGPGSGQG